jgi:hypothetical protein
LVIWPASGRNSAVECQLPKLDVTGSIPVARSNIKNELVGFRAVKIFRPKGEKCQKVPMAKVIANCRLRGFVAVRSVVTSDVTFSKLSR